MTDSSLDLLLKGRSDEFKDRVRALVQQYDIDENDPTFILLTGTTTLEVMLEKYPQEFEAAIQAAPGADGSALGSPTAAVGDLGQ